MDHATAFNYNDYLDDDNLDKVKILSNSKVFRRVEERRLPNFFIIPQNNMLPHLP